MSKLTKKQWNKIRVEREAGATLISLAKKYNVTHQLISKKAKDEGWGNGSDFRPLLKKKIAEKIAQIDINETNIKIAKQIDEEAERIAKIQELHRKEAEFMHGLFAEITKLRKTDEKAFANATKTGKILADMLQVIHNISRKAWNLDDVEIDTSKLTLEQIDYILATGKVPAGM